MKTILHSADTRGHADHGWLNSYHTFSFASYHNPDRVHFGMLRVLNDDVVKRGMGFGTHPHDNMEIVSIPLSGSLKHKDSMGHSSVIETNDVQIMSAGKGIQHSEINGSAKDAVNFLQVWVFPEKRNIPPRYAQLTYLPEDRAGQLKTVVAPTGNDRDTLWINQQAWFTLGNLTSGQTATYQHHAEGQGTYLFVITGEVTVSDQKLSRRDGLGICEVDKFELTAQSKAEFLLIEVPMA